MAILSLVRRKLSASARSAAGGAHGAWPAVPLTPAHHARGLWGFAFALAAALSCTTPVSAQVTVPVAPPVTATAVPANSAVPAKVTTLSTEQIAQKLVVSTVTIRVTSPAAGQGPMGLAPATGRATATPEGVSVASGVSLGNGRIVTFVTAPATARVRVTVPGDGESLEARLRAVDQYSGLSLLRIDRQDLPALEVSKTNPASGCTLFTAAGSGTDAPLVSTGILGGSNRTVGAFLPPLLQCDLRTTGSSCGAAVLDSHGKLAGIVVATESTAERAGWTYAVPGSHVERLLAAELKPNEPGVVVLERRRPELGLTMGPGTDPGSVIVERVSPGGPAAKAGLQAGDQVVETDGLKIRSVYQAVAVVLRKQPGDPVTFSVRRGADQLTLQITLGNAGKVAHSAVVSSADLGLGRATNIRPVGPDQVEIRELTYPGGIGPAAESAPTRISLDETGLLREQLTRWSRAMEAMQAEITRRDQQIKQLEEKLQRLEQQMQK